MIKNYCVHLYVYNNTMYDITDIDIDIDINVYLYNSDINIHGFGNMIFIQNVLDTIDKFIIIDENIDNISVIDKYHNMCYDIIGLKYDDDFKNYYTSNIIICSKALFKNKDIFYLNKKFSNSYLLWLLFWSYNNKLSTYIDGTNNMNNMNIDFFNIIMKDIYYDEFN
jgi:hypothetical protein